jgi:hypothetical protein
MKAEEFDQGFDRGEDVSSALGLSAAQRPGLSRNPRSIRPFCPGRRRHQPPEPEPPRDDS